MLREYRKMIWSDWNPFRNVSPRIMIMAFAVCLLIPNIMYHKKLILKKYERWWLSGTLFWIFIILSATLIGRQVQAEPRKTWSFLVPASCAADRKVQILGRHHWQYFVICSFGAADTVGFSAIIKTIYSIFLRNDTLCFNRTYTIFCKTGDTGIR